MDAAFDSTMDNPITESTQQPAAPTCYPFKGNLHKMEESTDQSMKGSNSAPAASKDNNIDVTPHAPSCDQHKEQMRISKGYAPQKNLPLASANTAATTSN